MNKQIEDITGRKFNYLTAISYNSDRSKKMKRTHWDFQCVCGKITSAYVYGVKNGNTKSCGCRPKRDLTGQKFNRLTAISYDAEKTILRGRTHWNFKCECGKEISSNSSAVTTGQTKSCGCLTIEMAIIRNSLPPGVAAFNRFLRSYKYNAKACNREWELSKDEFRKITSQNCHYCNITPRHFDDNGRFSSSILVNGIDRVDNSKGYIINNVVPCCSECNMAKGTVEYKTFIDWIKRVASSGIVH